MQKSSPFDLDEGIENIPVVKTPIQAVKTVASTTASYTKQQAKAVTKAFVSQLYGASSPTATDDDQQAATITDPTSQIKKTQTGSNPVATQVFSHTQQKPANTTASAQTPEEQAELDKARREIERQHLQSYVAPTLGRIDEDLETAIKREDQKREQEEKKRKQEEEEEKQRKEQEKAQAQNQQFTPPAGKSARRIGQKPIALRRAQTKTEINRGATG